MLTQIERDKALNRSGVDNVIRPHVGILLMRREEIAWYLGIIALIHGIFSLLRTGHELGVSC